MASRFIDTEIWKEDWFCDLGSEYQNFWNYITCHCNNAGIWKPNKIDFEIKTKIKINLSAFVDKVNEQGSKNRIIVTDSGRWFLTGFIAFQWFNKQESFDLFLSNRLHKHIYELLSKDGISLESVRGLREVLERSNQTSKDKGKYITSLEDKGVIGEKETFLVPTLLKIWKTKFPNYPAEPHKDFEPLRLIGEFIANQQGLSIETDVLQISKTFENIAMAVKADDWWANKPLSSIEKKVQEFYAKENV